MSSVSELKVTARVPEGVSLQPLQAYERTKRTFPPKTWWQRIGFKIWDAVERCLVHAGYQGDRPVFEVKDFPWVAAVEADWRKVRAELDEVMRFRDAMPSFQDIVKEVGNIQTDDQWKTFFLKGVGMECEENARRCPETMKVLEKIPGCTTGFFSILSPRKHIPPHRGPWAGVLRLHLGLMVPEPRQQCRIRIGDQVHAWEEGKVILFDDTFNHEVWNDTDGYRVVLFVDFKRPMRPPLSWLNSWIMGLSTLAPFLREAKGKQAAAERRFWERFGTK